MVNLTLKNVPEHLHQALKKEAECRGQSLNRYIVSLLEQAASESDRRKRMREHWGEFMEFRAALPRTAGSTELIRNSRERGR